jgi:hypothetical protein
LLEEIFKLVLTGLISGIAVFYFLLKYFFSSYVKEKGRNLATKQDIAEITNKVEEIKHQYNLLREQFKARNQLRLAALDKRLEVHQKAFSLLRELSFIICSGKETITTVTKCDNWWWENCFYLDAETREVFYEFIKKVPEKFHELPLKERIAIRTDMERIIVSLQEAVELPPIKDIKLDDFESKKEDKG